MGHQAREGERQRQADAHSAEDGSQTLHYYDAQDIVRSGAQRHANADLVRPLRYRVRNHAIDPHGGQHQRKRRENPEQEHGEPASRKRRRDNLAHTPDVVDWLFVAGLGNSAPQFRRDGSRIGGAPDDEIASAGHCFHERLRHLGDGDV